MRYVVTNTKEAPENLKLFIERYYKDEDKRVVIVDFEDELKEKQKLCPSTSNT